MDVQTLSQRRRRVAALLSALVIAFYFGFVLLIAFDREALGAQLIPGLSVGILLGAAVIVGAWLSTWVYARWATRHLDPHLEPLRAAREVQP